MSQASDNTHVSMDLFKSIIDAPSYCHDHQTCPAISRLAVALKYYSNLDITNQVDQGIFIDFVTNIYRNLIDDYTHFHKQHASPIFREQTQIEEIQNHLVQNYKFIDCHIKNCTFASRHHGVIHQKNESIDDQDFGITELYKQTMDSLHFYIFHIFDAGLRSSSKKLANAYNDKRDGKYFDQEFSKIKIALSKKRKNIERFTRFSRQRNSKFNIPIEQDTNSDHIDNEVSTEDVDTFMDSLFTDLSSNNATGETMDKLQAFLQNEEYETDALAIDITEFGENGNVLQQMKDVKSIRKITTFLRSTEKSIGSFSIGLRFYYWEFYKEIDELPADEQGRGFIQDHSGYRVSDLYVTKKYSSFGEEIMNYKYIHCNIRKFRDFILTKARKYIRTKLAKSTASNIYHNNAQHYGIDNNTPLGIPNMLSIILYTDTTMLSADFSASFRKVYQFDTLSQIKNRNRKYWHWAKWLRETVELYGMLQIDYDEYALTGPFYTGVCVMMNIPSFSLRLCAPTSTSVHLEVAVMFSGEDGLILQLKSDMIIQIDHNNIRGFDVSWISKFKEEDERLFIGGAHCIAVESIRLLQNCKNYQITTQTLYCLDSLISGNYVQESYWYMDIKQEHEILLRHLVEHYLKDGDCDQTLEDNYIYTTFECFIDHKAHLYFDLEVIDKDWVNDMMRNLVMPVTSSKQKYIGFECDEPDMTNIFSEELLKMFKPTKITITNCGGQHSFFISFWSLLSVIRNYTIDEIILQLGRTHDYPSNANTVTQALKDAYIDANYTISDLKNNADRIECVIKARSYSVCI